MRRCILLFLVVSLFCSPLISSAYAGQIQAKELTQTEATDLSAAQSCSADIVETVRCGGDGADAVLAGVGVFFIVLIIAAAAAS